MEQRALAFDHVPVIVIGVGAEHFGSAGDEVGDDGVERHAARRR